LIIFFFHLIFFIFFLIGRTLKYYNQRNRKPTYNNKIGFLKIKMQSLIYINQRKK